MKRFMCLALALLAICTCACNQKDSSGSSFADTEATYTVTVYDKDGNLKQNANVVYCELDENGEEINCKQPLKTDANGQATLTLPLGEIYAVHAEYFDEASASSYTSAHVHTSGQTSEIELHMTEKSF